ncbi:hypothetical protein FPV67DRAFT_231361 [Lyophyllum atratum]|nr:hypothetical protein FPV67DRAFT_231361 [Lyophyllum atratum]
MAPRLRPSPPDHPRTRSRSQALGASALPAPRELSTEPEGRRHFSSDHDEDGGADNEMEGAKGGLDIPDEEDHQSSPPGPTLRTRQLGVAPPEVLDRLGPGPHFSKLPRWTDLQISQAQDHVRSRLAETAASSSRVPLAHTPATPAGITTHTSARSARTEPTRRPAITSPADQRTPKRRRAGKERVIDPVSLQEADDFIERARPIRSAPRSRPPATPASPKTSRPQHTNRSRISRTNSFNSVLHSSRSRSPNTDFDHSRSPRISPRQRSSPPVLRSPYQAPPAAVPEVMTFTQAQLAKLFQDFAADVLNNNSGSDVPRHRGHRDPTPQLPVSPPHVPRGPRVAAPDLLGCGRPLDAVALAARVFRRDLDPVGLAPGFILQPEETPRGRPLRRALLDPPAVTLPAPATTLHGLPPRVGILLCADETVIPAKVVKILRAGYREYIPLDSLTDAACTRAATEPVQPDTGFSIGAAGDLRLRTSHLDAKNEVHISLIDWCQAAPTLIRAMRQHFLAAGDDDYGGPNAKIIAMGFERHFELLRLRRDFQSQFDVALAYDMHLRRSWVLDSSQFRMDVFHGDIWDHFMRAKQGTMLNLLKARLDASSSDSFRNKARTPDTANQARRGDAAARPNVAAAGDQPRVRCMFCGSRDHKYPACKHVGLYLHKDNDGKWRSPTGATYCIGHNGPKPCARGEACIHVHACSLCGNGLHNAQICPACAT